MIKTVFDFFLNIFKLTNSKNQKNLNLIKEIETIVLENYNNRKWYISEAFFQLTGLRLSYNDICHIVNENNINKILFYIKKYPGVYEYKNGKFKYTKQFTLTFQKIDKYINILMIWSFGILSLLFVLVVAFVDSLVFKIEYFIYLFITIVIWYQGIKAKEELEEVNEIIKTQFYKV